MRKQTGTPPIVCSPAGFPGNDDRVWHPFDATKESASRTSQTGFQSQLAESLTPTSTATPALAERFTLTPTATPETVEQSIPSATIAERPPSLAYLYSDEVDAIQGRILARGDNPNATADSLLKSYRVEELELPKSIPVRIDGTKTQISVACRLTIQGGPFSQYNADNINATLNP